MSLAGNSRFVVEARNWVDDKDVAELKARPFPASTVVFAKIGEALKGNRFRVLVRETLLDNNMMGAVPRPDVVEPLFLHALLECANLAGDAAGTALPYLRAGDLKARTFMLPPLAEQVAIALVLCALDDKIESNKRICSQLVEVFDQSFAACFGAGCRRYSEPPAGWRTGTVADLSMSKYGYTASAGAELHGPRFLRVMDINKRRWVEWSTVPHCEIEESQIDKYLLEHGDIVVARMADPGKVVLCDFMTQPTVPASYLVRLRPASYEDALFLYGYMASPAYQRDYVSSAIGGSVQKNMNAKVLTAAPLAIPPAGMLAEFAATAAPLRESLAHMVTESAVLREVRNALLPRLVSGQIRVPMSDDSAESLGVAVEALDSEPERAA